MAFNSTNPVVAGEKARASHFTRLWNNAVALKEGRLSHDLGGFYADALEDTVLVIPSSAVHAEIDGTNLGGDLTVEMHAMCMVASGTGYLRLYNVTDLADVGAAVSFTSVTPTLVKITGLTLATGLKAYTFRMRGSVSTALPRCWGAKLILR